MKREIMIDSCWYLICFGQFQRVQASFGKVHSVHDFAVFAFSPASPVLADPSQFLTNLKNNFYFNYQVKML